MITTRTVLGSRVYLHPEPHKIIHFIGGFGFGSCPNLFYHQLAQKLANKGYSVVLHPFPFNPFAADHWSLALSLYKRLKILQLKELPKITSDTSFLQASNHVWLGHSLGCKLIELLEILTLEEPARTQALRSILSASEVDSILAKIDQLSNELGDVATALMNDPKPSAMDSPSTVKTRSEAVLPGPAREQLESLLKRRTDRVPLSFIKDQASILMAPQISGAVRLPLSSVTIYNADVEPSWEESCYLVRSQTTIFQLTGLVKFISDGIASDDVLFLQKVLEERNVNAHATNGFFRELPGFHLAPLQPSDALIVTLDSLLSSLSGRLVTQAAQP
jgi:hypothetical protein